MSNPEDAIEAVALAIWDEREKQFPPRVRTKLDDPEWNAIVHLPLMGEQAQAAITAAKPFIERELLRKMLEPSDEMLKLACDEHGAGELMSDGKECIRIQRRRQILKQTAQFLARDLGYSAIGE